MKTAVVCYYMDMGRPYLPLIENMTASVKAVMPDTRTVLLTPTPNCNASQFFDHTQFIGDRPTDETNICRERGVAMASWMLAKHGCDTIFVDPDIVFRNKPEFDSTFDIGLMWRTDKPDQPINTGLILAKPDRDKFWRHYGNVIVNLPKPFHYWWCDQLAFALLTGVCHYPGDTLLVDDARVRLFKQSEVCPVSGEAWDTTSSAWAVHYKGRRKGPEWDQIYRGEEPARVNG